MNSVEIIIAKDVSRAGAGMSYYTNWKGKGPHICLWEGGRGVPHNAGATLAVGELIKRPLMSKLDNYGGKWFEPYIRSMAAGECFSVDDIVAFCKAHNGGMEPERNTIVE